MYLKFYFSRNINSIDLSCIEFVDIASIGRTVIRTCVDEINNLGQVVTAEYLNKLV